MSTLTKTATARLQVKKFIKASRDRAYAAWTQPELMRRWFAPGPMTCGSASADVRVGGAYRVQMLAAPGGGGCDDNCGNSEVAGKYVRIVPGELISFTWQWQNDPEAPETLVTVEFKDAPGGTEVTLTHERLPSEESRDKHQHGWTGCLDNLAALATRGGLSA